MNKKKKDPAFLLYPKEFLADTAFLSNEQVGIYIKMMCFQHHKGHLSEKEIARISEGEPDDEVMAMFQMDDDGLWYSAKLEDEIQRRKSYAESQRERANKRWSKDDATAHATADATADANDIPRDVTETVTGTGTGTGYYSLDTIEGKHTTTIPDTLADLYNDIYQD
jgi:uncharacterized protein YdaU (DUF1376 family)